VGAILSTLGGIIAPAWTTILAAVGGLVALAILFLGIRKGGVDAQKSKDQEVAIRNDEKLDQRIDDAHSKGDDERTAPHNSSDSVHTRIPGDKYDRG
jgi:hypothetical protein